MADLYTTLSTDESIYRTLHQIVRGEDTVAGAIFEVQEWLDTIRQSLPSWMQKDLTAMWDTADWEEIVRALDVEGERDDLDTFNEQGVRPSVAYADEEEEPEDEFDFPFPPVPSDGSTELPRDRIRREMPTREAYEEACRQIGVEPRTDTEILNAGYHITTRQPDGTAKDKAYALHLDRLILLVDERQPKGDA